MAVLLPIVVAYCCCLLLLPICLLLPGFVTGNNTVLCTLNQVYPYVTTIQLTETVTSGNSRDCSKCVVPELHHCSGAGPVLV